MVAAAVVAAGAAASVAGSAMSASAAGSAASAQEQSAANATAAQLGMFNSTQNAASARGLGVSGAALKGAAGYATGLADSTYQNQFNNLLANQNNLFNRQNTVFGNILSMGQLGANAAAGLATNATQTGSNIGSNMIGAGNAAAAGQIGQANAISSGLTGASGNAQNLLLFNALLKNSGGQGLFSAGSGGNSNTG
jgi:hypothetical protein